MLDGQQRLTALNIALQGTYAYKLPRLWWSNPDAFPVRHLCLNLFQDAKGNEQGMRYDFRFLTEEEAAVQDDSRCWYPVRNVLRAGDSIALFEYLTERLNHMTPSELSKPLKILDRLREAVHVKRVIAFYEETSQDIDRVLDVFIRTNSGGMTLSRSDMLMSIATAHWKGDARNAINGAVQRINDPHVGEFGFSRDFLLKAGLMLAGIRSVAFRVTNFTINNIELLNDRWDRITDSVYAAARLVRDFGFSQSTLGHLEQLRNLGSRSIRRGIRSHWSRDVAWLGSNTPANVVPRCVRATVAEVVPPPFRHRLREGGAVARRTRPEVCVTRWPRLPSPNT